MSYIDNMSPSDFKAQRLSKNEARKQVTKIISKHPANIYFSSHALEELDNDDLTTADALNVLKSPNSKIHKDGEFKNGSYRYRLETNNLMIVIAFQEAGDGISIITAWDKRKR